MGLSVFSFDRSLVCVKCFGAASFRREAARSLVSVGMAPCLPEMKFVRYSSQVFDTPLFELTKERISSIFDIPERKLNEGLERFGLSLPETDEIFFCSFRLGRVEALAGFKIAGERLVLKGLNYREDVCPNRVFPMLISAALNEARKREIRIGEVCLLISNDQYLELIDQVGKPEEAIECDVYSVRLRNQEFRDELLERIKNVSVSESDEVSSEMSNLIEMTGASSDIRFSARYLGRWSFAPAKRQKELLDSIREIAKNGNYSVRELIEKACFGGGFYGKYDKNSMNYESSEAVSIEERCRNNKEIPHQRENISPSDIVLGLIDIKTALGKDILPKVLRERAALLKYTVLGAFDTQNTLVGYSVFDSPKRGETVGLHFVYVAEPSPVLQFS